MHGYELDKPAHDPFEVAKSKAIQGVEAGLVVYNLTHEALRATFVFTPEVSLNKAMIMLPICGICLLYTSPSPRDAHESRMPSSA